MSRALVVVLGLAIAASAAARPGTITTIVHPAPTPALGPDDALVTVDLYFVPGAEASHAAYRQVRELARRHPTRVRARFYPRQFGPYQAPAAIALAAHRRGAFFALLDAAVARPRPPTTTELVALANELGLPPDVALRAARDPDLIGALADNDRRAVRLGAPALEVALNGQPVSAGPLHLTPTEFTAEQLEQAYQLALAAARLAAAQGLTGGELHRRHRLASYCEDDPTPPSTDAAPAYAWSLSRLTDDGTVCRAPAVRPARLDDPLDDDDPTAPPALLAAPLPTAGAPALGPADAAIPIAIACNPRGESCRAQLSALRALVPLYDGEVRLSWVPWIDLGFEAAAADVELAAAALCAGELGDGWPFANDPAGVRREPPTLADLAREAHVDPEAVARCGARSLDRVRTMVAAAERAGVTRGPTVVIAGRAYIGGFVDPRMAVVIVEQTLAPGVLGELLR